MLKGYRVLAVAACVLLLTACETELPSEGGGGPTGYAEPLSESQFETLTPVQQYQVASKLLGTMYKGIPVEDFLSLSGDLSNPQLRTPNSSAHFLRDVQDALNTELSNSELNSIQQIVLSDDEPKYEYSGNDDITSSRSSSKEEPLAFIHETPLSRDSFIRWMAHFLANTIMFSPAEEMESTDNTDVRRTYKLLIDGLTAGNSVRQIIRAQLPSLQRWRVARTPENVGIEGFELYLGLFDTINDAKKVGIACQDFYLLDADDGYLLETTNLVNTEPQIILQEDMNGDGVGETGGYFVTTCNDFYDVLAGHPLIIPRTCEVVANYLMAERSLDDRLALCESIASSGASTFEDIFKGILFSEQYLLHTERPKGFEETFMPALQALKWDARQNSGSSVGSRIWLNMASENNINNPMYMGHMGWHTMTLKIGRTPQVPTDALSFANYHKAVREQLLRNRSSYQGGGSASLEGLIYAANGALLPEIQSLSMSNYLHFLFLTAIQRPAFDTEIQGLIPILQAQGNVSTQQQIANGRHDEIAQTVFDYASRLPEYYYFRNIQSGVAQ